MRERMPRVLIFLTSSYPFGTGEPFVSGEIPYLAAEFDELVIVSNNTDDEPHYMLPEGVTCLRVPYELSPTEKLRSPFVLLDPEPRAELRRLRPAYALPITRRIRKTILLSWAKANK